MSHSQGPTNRPSSFSNYVLADRSVTKIDGEGPFYVVVNLLAVAVYITSPTTNASCASCSGSMHETLFSITSYCCNGLVISLSLRHAKFKRSHRTMKTNFDWG